MATDKLINSTQGDDIIDALNDIADNVGNITYGPQTSSDKVVSMLGYAEAAEAASINPGDTLNVAIGKLEKKANDNATNVANKIDKLTNATAGDIATVTATGEIADSTVSIADSNTGLADSDTAVPTSKTVKTYVDSTATGISRYLGTITAASGLSTSAKKGDFYVVKTAWTGVHAGDEIIAEKDGPAQTIDGTNWSLLHNEADTDTKYQFGEGTTNGTFLVTPSDTGVAQPVPIKGLGSAAYTTADTSSLTNDNNHVPTSALAKSLLDAKVPTTRKVNNKALSSDITLSASDVSAVPSSNVTTTLPASSAAASTSKVMSEKLVYDNYVQNSDFVVAEQNILSVQNKVGKNLLNPYTPDVTNYDTGRGITYTNNKDGTWYVAGTSTINDAYIDLYQNQSVLPWGLKTGDVIKITTNTNKVNVAIIPITSGGYGSTVAGNASTVGTLAITSDITGMLVRFQVGEAGTVTNENVIGMVCHEEAWNLSHDIELYGAPNSTLTGLQAEDRAGLVECVDGGAKNLLKRTASGSSWTDDNVTFTLNSDGSITINSTGTITASRYFAYFEGRMSELVNTAGNYVLFASASPNAQAQVWWYYTDDWTNVVETSGNSSKYISASDLNRPVIVRIRALAGNAISNVKVYPMICTKAAFCVSSKFVPYRPNWDLVDSRIDVLEKNSSMSISASSKYYLEIANASTDTISTDNRGVILVSIPYQTGTYIPSLYLVHVTNGVFRNPIALTPTENATVISTTISTGDDGRKIYFEVRGSSWCPPVIVPLFANTNEVKLTMRYLDAIPT